MSTKSTEFLHHMTPHACTQDPRFFSRKLLSKCFEIKPQLMMATFIRLQNLVRVPPERVHNVLNHSWGDKTANNKENYGLSNLSAGSNLSRTLFSLISCTTCFTRLLAPFRWYIQRLVSMSIADGLASTNLLLLYILAIYLHIYVLCFKNIRYIWIPTKTVGDLVYIPRQNICNHYVYGSTNSWPIPFEREPTT